MASSSCSSHLSLLTTLLLLSTSSISAAADSKVSLALYYETLCPYCSNFIVNYLAEIFDNGLISIVDLDLIPYGNAHVRDGTITCQHGEYECILNTVEGCAIKAWPDLEVHFRFINCVETLVYNQAYLEWETCFEKTGLDSKPVMDCFQNGTGHQLDLQYGAITDALEPPHKYVPWVVVNGEPLYDDYMDFKAIICKAYKGNNRPKVCDESVLKISKEKNGVSYNTESGSEMKIEMVV